MKPKVHHAARNRQRRTRTPSAAQHHKAQRTPRTTWETGRNLDDANDLRDEDEDEDEDNDTRRRERLKRTNKQTPNYQQTTVAHEQ